MKRTGIASLLSDFRIRRLLLANTLGSIGSGITIFAVPWLLVREPNGSQAFRWTTLATTLVLFAFMPGYGAWLDKHSRKAGLLASEAFGFLATISMATLGLALGAFAPWQLMTVYFCGMFYYTMHYPAKFAFIQQVFEPAQYQSLTGLMEIQGQTAMMIAGGLGGLLVGRVPLWGILLFDASTYAASYFLLSTIPYRATHIEEAAKTVEKTGPTAASPGESSPGAAPAKPGLWRGVMEGFLWLRARPRLLVFLTCSFMPFIAVMVGNYLFPVYVTQTLKAGPEIFAGGEILFALGAVAAGAILPRLLSRAKASATIPGTMIAYCLGLAALAFIPHAGLYMAANLVLGFGNAGVRVARSALMLHEIPQGVMGRVGVFYNVFDRLLRTLLVGAMAIVDVWGPPSGFFLLLTITLLALAGAILSRGAAGSGSAS